MIKIEDIEKIENLADENAKIAKEQMLKADEMKNLVILEIKRAKAREILVENELELAKMREKLAERSKKLVEKKEKVKTLLKFSKEALIYELIQANYNEQIAEIQKEEAAIQKKIADIETIIAEVKGKLINKKISEAQARKNLAKTQLIYIQLVKTNDSDEKIRDARKSYSKQQDEISRIEAEANKINKNIVEKQVELANLKKKLSTLLGEREKIRPMLSDL